jgi:hypothetical protein
MSFNFHILLSFLLFASLPISLPLHCLSLSFTTSVPSPHFHCTLFPSSFRPYPHLHHSLLPSLNLYPHPTISLPLLPPSLNYLHHPPPYLLHAPPLLSLYLTHLPSHTELLDLRVVFQNRFSIIRPKAMPLVHVHHSLPPAHPSSPLIPQSSNCVM